MGRDTTSRYSEIRLLVGRATSSQAVWAVLVRRVEGGGRRDRLVARGVFDCPPGSPESTSVVAALERAVQELDGQAEFHVERTGAERRPGAPQGPQGGLPDHPLTRPLP